MPNDRPDESRCTYCGVFLTKQKGTSAWRNKEHAVARQLFLKPRPDLTPVVVPSCRGCNERLKPDEDYFRSLLSLTEAGESEVGRRFHEEIGMRVYDKDDGLRRKIANGLKGVRLRSPTTRRVVKEGMTQHVDWPRVHRVVGKWVRGLHWKAYGERLPKETRFEVALREDAESFSEPGQGWPGTFEFWHSRHAVDPLRTRWIFRVWEKFGVIASTNEDMPVRRVGLIDRDYPGHLVEHFSLVPRHVEPPKSLIILP